MALTESQRHPLLDQTARRRLEAWREHTRAPLWNTACGDRLRAPDLEDVRLFAHACDAAPCWDSFSIPPFWARESARKYLHSVPFYRERGGDAGDWLSIPPCDRLDLAREPWHFVPDGLALDEMVVYNTSGTTGSEAWIPTHWRWPSTYLPLYERALGLAGVGWQQARAEAPERVAIATIAAQQHTLTFASWSSYLGGAYLKVNLHPSQWRDPSDTLAFLHDADPLVLCGDPVSLSALAATDFHGRPLALISSAIALSPIVRRELEARFGRPLIDVFSLSESGPIAASVGSSTCSEFAGAMAILPPDLWVEILRPDGSACRSDEVGEVTLTGGRNPFAPLLRYRTGDFARGQIIGGAPHLLDFHGRALIKFAGIDASGAAREILDIDVTHALKDIALREFSLHQDADGSLRFRFRAVLGAAIEPAALAASIEAALRPMFGRSALRIEEANVWPHGARKMIRYSSDAAAGSGLG